MNNLQARYNHRISKFIKYDIKDVKSWTIGVTYPNGLTDVHLHMTDGGERVVSIRRHDLTQVFEIDNNNTMDLDASLVDDLAWDSLMSALGLSKRDVTVLNSLEFKHTLLFWSNKQRFVPPQDIEVTLNEQVPKTNYNQYLVTAKDNSLGYIGAIETKVTGELAPIPPVEEDGIFFDLNDLADVDRPGVWNLSRAKSAALNTEEEINEFQDTVVNHIATYHNSVTIDDLSFHIVKVENGSDVTVEPNPLLETTSIIGKILIELREWPPFDLSLLTNTNTPGVIEYHYDEIESYGDPRYLVPNVLTIISAEHADEIDPNSDVYLTQLEMIAAPEENPDEDTTVYYIVPPSHSNEYTIIGRLKVLLKKVITNKIRFRLNNFGLLDKKSMTDSKGKKVITWAVPENYDLATEKQLILKEFVAAASERDNVKTEYFSIDNIDVTVDDQHNVTFKPTSTARYNKALGKHTVKFIITPALNGVDRNWEKLALNSLDEFKYDYYPTVHLYYATELQLKQAVKDGALTEWMLNQLTAKHGLKITTQDITVQRNDWDNRVTISTRWGNQPSRTSGKIDVKGSVTVSDSLESLQLAGVPFSYDSKSQYDKAVSAYKRQIKNAIEQTSTVKIAEEEIAVKIINDSQVEFKYIDSPVLSSPVLPGSYNASLAKEYVTNYKLNLDICTNNGVLGEWEHVVDSLTEINEVNTVNRVFALIRETVAPNANNIVSAGLEHIREGNDILISGGSSNGALTIKLKQ